MRRLALVLAMLPLGVPAPAIRPASKATASADRPSPGDEEKRLRLTRSLGLAVALDLDEAQAGKMRDSMARFDVRCQVLRRRHLDASRFVRRVASGDPATVGQVDDAVRNLLDLQTQIQMVHGEMFQEISKDLSAQNRARAAVFFALFRERFGVTADARGSGARRKPGR